MKLIPHCIFTEEFKKSSSLIQKNKALILAEMGRNLDISPKSLKACLI
jgi:hypothetical protein